MQNWRNHTPKDLEVVLQSKNVMTKYKFTPQFQIFIRKDFLEKCVTILFHFRIIDYSLLFLWL